MLQLKNIVKDYQAGDEMVHALKGLNIQFREHEFVSILGPSGCGKTTLLNIIGGLDQYTSGDLVIGGTSTKKFRDRDWDAYRNHSVGFVFQSYNLIPHQSVLSNVELALTLSGVSKAERRRRAAEVLKKVGLANQMHKRPNQMSGGQMQRVAIARALVNEPEILLADEPTGALDTETSVQIMELLKEVASDRLVIMVTHNPDLAQQYSTRIVKLLDGEIVDDSAPYDGKDASTQRSKEKSKKTSMSSFTAFSLSLNNLMTKKTRTFLTAFAGSIGIIGIALIMALSNGIQSYIDQVQEETLSSYPIDIEAESVDMTGLVTSLMSARNESTEAVASDGKIHTSKVMYDVFNSMNSAETQTNNLKDFKVFLENEAEMQAHISAVQYSYAMTPEVYTTDPDGKIIKSDITDLMSGVYGEAYASYSSFSSMDIWQEMLPGNDGELVSDMTKSQYDVVYGNWPAAADEVVLIVNQNDQLSDLVLYAMGLKSGDELTEIFKASLSGEELDTTDESWSYEELCACPFKLVLPTEHYQYNATDGIYTQLSSTETGLDYLYNSDSIGIPLKIVGIVRAGENNTGSASMTGSIGYTTALTELMIERTNAQEIVQKQQEAPTVDVINGLPFATDEDTEPTAEEKKAMFTKYVQGLSNTEKAALYTSVMSEPAQDYVDALVEQNVAGLTRADIEDAMLTSYAAEMEVDPETIRSYITEMDDEALFGYMRDAAEQAVRQQYAERVQASLGTQSGEALALAFDSTEFTDEQYTWMYDNFMPPTKSDSTYEENLKLLGCVQKDSPSAIYLYASTFADKDAIADVITRYNDAATEENKITYTDYVALLMSSITSIISAISYVLIAFVAISLVVSSIMIGIITYISVLERTKEIGILRAIGASKKDVSRVFNAETLLVGFCSGVLGIGLTLLLTLPINAIIRNLTGIAELSAALPVAGALILIGISVLLTFIAGLIPSGLAAKKDPVVALRSE